MRENKATGVCGKGWANECGKKGRTRGENREIGRVDLAVKGRHALKRCECHEETHSLCARAVLRLPLLLKSNWVEK
jgi:hypothetical protein